MLIRAASFLTVFLLLACTITAISAAMYEIPVQEEILPAQEAAATEAPQSVYAEKTQSAAPAQTDSAEEPTAFEVDEHIQIDTSYTPRMNAPEEDNPCYYSDDNIFYASDYGMPNCTCYAWGRVYEISGETPALSSGDACTWYTFNAENGIYDYGDTPQEGAVACWAYADGGPGHVAVVEQVEDGKVLLSNSAYSGEDFYMDTVPADDPSDGREGWIFQGYIYPDKQA